MGNPDIVNAFLGATVGSGVTDPIFDKLIEGLKYVYHCKDECTALREELEKVKPMLVKISDKHKADPAMKNWLEDFGKCVKRADEILGTCKSDSSKIWDRFHEVRYGVQILELRDQIRAAVSLAPMALLTLQSGSTSESRKGTCGIVQEVPGKILGMEDHFKRVKSSVLEGHKSAGRSCVGIRGMGGAGKTLLAQMVNNDEEIQQVFGKESVIWITVGRDAEISVIYDRMRKRVQVRSDGGSLEDQRTELMNAFMGREVLLILDDVWGGISHKCVEMVDWLNIATGPGSVTLVTTRDESVTRKCVNAGEEIILRLSEEQSWELFCTHAFGTETPTLNKELEGLARDVCKECKCLPLALKVIGRAVKGKSDVREWRKTLKHLRASSSSDKNINEQLFERLRFSYEELDGPTKICFLYFAAFPEDCEVPVEQLCRIWMAEGLFGEDSDEEEAWDEPHVAVNELLRRSLIEGCKVHRGKHRYVKMHDILRDLAIQLTRQGDECERESLFKMERKDLEEFPSSWLGSEMKVKRLSVWGNKIKRFSDNFIAPSLKICMLYPEPWQGYYRFGSGTAACKIEEDFFGNLHGLKFLQICVNQTIWQLPESMGGLGSLQHIWHIVEHCNSFQRVWEDWGPFNILI